MGSQRGEHRADPRVRGRPGSVTPRKRWPVRHLPRNLKETVRCRRFGGHVTARPVAVCWMADENGPDAEIICVPPTDPRWAEVRDVDQLPEGLLGEVHHFFDIDKDLEPGKEASVRGYGGREAGWAEVAVSRLRFEEAQRSRTTGPRR